MNEYPDFAGIEPPPFEEAGVAILPVPYEGTVTYGTGTSRGPAAILEASCQLELYDDQLRLEPCRAGVVVDREFQVPDLPASGVAAAVGRRCGRLLDDGKWVVTLGGEHSITAGAVAAAAGRFPGLEVVQLDAHADLRDSFEGDDWSHACAMARAMEHAAVRAVGVRSYSAGEAERISAGLPGYMLLHAWEMAADGWIDRVLHGIDGLPVYLTIDLDYFDPALMPATGTPEPGGGSWWQTMEFLERLFRRARVVAADLVELAPIPGLHHPDYTAARLLHKMIGWHLAGSGLS